MAHSNGITNGATNGVNGTADLDLDALVIGCGFGGLYTLYKLREKGLNAVAIDAADGLGGVWHWNRYPGARVDSEVPYYQYSLHQVWKDWSWSERFPAHDELRRYFNHAASALELNEHIRLQQNVVDCTWDNKDLRWTVTTESGLHIRCKYLVAAAGSSYRKYLPKYPGIEDYKGTLLHSAGFPEEDAFDFRGKSVAIIGQGATGVQLTQSVSKLADTLHVFCRTPNMAFPMKQRKMSVQEQNQYKGAYDLLFKATRASRSGLPHTAESRSMLKVTDEEREARWNELWERGGFNFSMGGFRDYVFNEQANDLIYNFWRRKVQARIKDARKAEIMAPKVKPHPFGTKRPSLEQDYYECIDRENVNLISVKDNPIERITADGIQTADGKVHKAAYIIMATGYDAITGSYTNMGLKDRDGVDLKERWKNGVKTHLGLMVPGVPNMFMVYSPQGKLHDLPEERRNRATVLTRSPQAPTALANGSTIVECQGDWVADAIEKMRREHVRTIEVTPDAAQKWGDAIQEMNEKTLFPLADSWYMGANIPGKKREQLNYLGGVAQYEAECRKALENWDGFVLDGRQVGEVRATL
ncbi:hypothetical protein AYO21_00808 [Fonsecaea monophora]|uniref:FAD/NAD(P)-binding domain-containing protein n=1 Tax=Fonsecaea monophora TaxID=254056 RepID=A0A177FMD5_9EURO|nr:hypothetical protein AYO21_00808 [Fonsecaea monophora]OAG44846.1 hypothetical protein AYO21_00808 [Fonsecaea monophora]